VITSKRGRDLKVRQKDEAVQVEFDEMLQQIQELDELFQKAAKELEDLYKDPRYKDEDD
jgi:hypothetical protein